jgi:hypothetical protein
MNMNSTRLGGAWAQRPAMMGNLHPAFRAQMGIAPALVVAAKWGPTLLLTVGGFAAAAFAAKSAIPEIPINKEKIGLAAGLGGVGITSYLIADVVPEGWRAIPYALAAAGIGSSLYFLFSKPVESEVSIYSNEDYAGISAMFTSPPRGGEASTGFLSEDYEITLHWKAKSKVDFLYRFLIREQMSGIFGTGPKTTRTIYPDTRQMELSGAAFKPRSYKIDVEPRFGWVSAVIEMDVEVFNPNTTVWQSVGSNFFNVTRWW